MLKRWLWRWLNPGMEAHMTQLEHELVVERQRTRIQTLVDAERLLGSLNTPPGTYQMIGDPVTEVIVLYTKPLEGLYQLTYDRLRLALEEPA